MSLITELNARLATPEARANNQVDEFTELLHAVLQDDDADIRNAGAFIAQALQQRANGWLDEEDIITLLEGQRDIAQLRANNAQIARATRIRGTIVRLIDIALRSLIRAL